MTYTSEASQQNSKASQPEGHNSSVEISCANFAQLYEEMQPDLRVYVARIIYKHPNLDVDAIVNDTFCNVYQTLRNRERDENFRVDNLWSYLTTAARHTFFKCLRRQKKDAAIMRSLDEGEDDRVELRCGETTNFEVWMDARNALHDVAKAIQWLPTPQRETLVLLTYGYTECEIAKLLDRNVNTIKSDIHRARKRLRVVLSRSEENESPL